MKCYQVGLSLWFISAVIAHPADVPLNQAGPNQVSPPRTPVPAAPKTKLNAAPANPTSGTNAPARATVATVANWELQYALKPAYLGGPAATGSGRKSAGTLVPPPNRNDWFIRTNWQLSLRTDPTPGSKPAGGTVTPRVDVDFKQTATLVSLPDLLSATPDSQATSIIVSSPAVVEDTKPNLNLNLSAPRNEDWHREPADLLPGY